MAVNPDNSTVSKPLEKVFLYASTVFLNLTITHKNKNLKPL